MYMPKLKNKDDNQNSNENSLPIPKNVLNSLNEFTIGGFALFFFDVSSGKPTQIMKFENPVCALAMQAHITQFIETLHAVSLNMSVQGMINNMNGENGESEDNE